MRCSSATTSPEFFSIGIVAQHELIRWALESHFLALRIDVGVADVLDYFTVGLITNGYPIPHSLSVSSRASLSNSGTHATASAQPAQSARVGQATLLSRMSTQTSHVTRRIAEWTNPLATARSTSIRRNSLTHSTATTRFQFTLTLLRHLRLDRQLSASSRFAKGTCEWIGWMPTACRSMVQTIVTRAKRHIVTEIRTVRSVDERECEPVVRSLTGHIPTVHRSRTTPETAIRTD